MSPLNPFLRAFFRSAIPSQCYPINHHVLLVPTTEVLLNSKDRETNTLYADLASTEEFLASHVFRVPGGVPSHGYVMGGNARENKNKAKQYSTANGRTVVVKETYVYSNKGFKTLNQAQILQDFIYYPDSLDGQQWLVYYISRPLVGSYQAAPVVPAIISDEPSRERRKLLAEASSGSPGLGSSAAAGPPVPRKKEIKNFGDLLTQFPLISRQMQGGLERVIREFVAANEKPIPKRSRRSSVSSQSSGPSISDSLSSIQSSLSGSSTVHPTSIELEPEEETMRTSLETAVTAVIDLFQNVDKAQLSLLGANTELTGPVVERMIERYFTEQIHDQTLFPRVCAVRRSEDSDLDTRVRRMADVDIAQVGIPFDEGMEGKRELAARLSKGIQAFRKMGVASSPQEMLEILLNTQKFITEAASPPSSSESNAEEGHEKPSAALTINADVLVSMLLIVVIRSGVRHLHSRLLCMRYFIFVDEVESGEQGYALATLEAVLTHLTNAANGLRKTSKRNRLLWQAAKSDDITTLNQMLEPGMLRIDEDHFVDSPTIMADQSSSDEYNGTVDSDGNDVPDGDLDGSLSHVFPFQKPLTPPPEQQARTKAKKRVSMASLPRNLSISSGFSSRSHSRHMSVDSATSGSVGEDLSSERLAQTQDVDGNSVLMMAVDAGAAASLKCLLAMPAHFRSDFILQDTNGEGASLLSVAVQSGNREITDVLITFIEEHASDEDLRRYLELQDSKGRCVAHYLFTQPHLIQKFGKKLPWRLKDKNGQTPLFALCRSYDHEEYRGMVNTAIQFATETQDDGQPLHLDDHVDGKSNTLLHVTNDTQLTLKLLHHCDSDVNAANDKRFTPLMVSSKYGRLDLVRALFGDPRTDMSLRDFRGLGAVELAKDDDVRNRIDDMVLLSSPAGPDGRITTVVRSFFVEDATIRFVLKSGALNPNGMITVTTCKRSIADFENLARWLSLECPASWLPTQFSLPSPFLLPNKPSRAVLRDVQIRLDNFFRSLLTHATFSTHELVWEFFLVPEVDVEMLTERSKRKAEARVDNVKQDYEPVLDTLEVENFVEFAREQVRGVVHATRRLLRATNRQRMLHADLFEAHSLLSSRLSTLLFLPQPHLRAFERLTKTLQPTDASPLVALYYALHSTHSTATALQTALDRPAYLIGSMSAVQRALTRSLGGSTSSRSSRWIGGLFEEARKQAEGGAEKARAELETLACDLRYTQQTVATELAGWQDEHARSGRRVLRDLAKGMVVRERARLEGMRRALREIRRE